MREDVYFHLMMEIKSEIQSVNRDLEIYGFPGSGFTYPSKQKNVYPRPRYNPG